MDLIQTPSKQFIDGDRRTPGTPVPAWWLNQLQGELAAVIKDAGIELDKSDPEQLKKAMQAIIEKRSSVTIDSIAALRQKAGVSNQVVIVRGYYADKPGVGGGLFYASTDKLADNGGTVIHGEDGTTWVKFDTHITPHDFGARGSVDDTAAFEKLNKAMGNDEVIDLDGMTYAVQSIPAGRYVNGSFKVGGIVYPQSLAAHEKSGFRVATWNIWGTGSSNAYFDAERLSASRVYEIKKQLLKLGVDITGLQETHHNAVALPVSQYTVGRLKSVAAAVSMSFKNGDQYGNITLATADLIDKSAVVYASPGDNNDGEPRSYLMTRYRYGSKLVSVYNTHLSTSTLRISAMAAELVAAVLQDKSDVVFVLGDFNTVNWTLFSGLTDSGFQMVNNSQHDTKPGVGVWYIDNIFYKGATLTHSGIFEDTRLADHAALYADFTI